jgi:hypothetical protein
MSRTGGEMNRRELVKSSALVIVPGLSLVISGADAAGWALRFNLVHDKLQVRFDSSDGKLISWPDRGLGGQYTWSWKDPAPETRDISAFTGGLNQITLWARIESESKGSAERICNMITTYGGSDKQSWRFDNTEWHKISK